MEPVILLGAIIGTYVNKILEGKTLVVLLVLLLIAKDVDVHVGMSHVEHVDQIACDF